MKVNIVSDLYKTLVESNTVYEFKLKLTDKELFSLKTHFDHYNIPSTFYDFKNYYLLRINSNNQLTTKNLIIKGLKNLVSFDEYGGLPSSLDNYITKNKFYDSDLIFKLQKMS